MTSAGKQRTSLSFNFLMRMYIGNAHVYCGLAKERPANAAHRELAVQIPMKLSVARVRLAKQQ